MRVLLATDGSADAQAATVWLRDFPLPPGTTVSVLSVAQLPKGPLRVPTVEEFEDAVRRAAQTVAEAARTVLEPRWPGAQCRVIEGGFADPREAIVEAAAGADLVVLGARGLGAVKGFLLGSVSVAVARHARCSVAVVKETPRPLRRAVVGVDGSEPAAKALRFLEGIGSGLRDVTVTLVGVLEEVLVPATAPSMLRGRLRALAEDVLRERRAEMDRVLTAAGRPLASWTAMLEHKIEVGHAGEVLVAASRDCDLVVVGARGLGGFERLLLGSVSERVLREAGCPVVIVK
jgi:nucleotide-binding universal stress UspA family protein